MYRFLINILCLASIILSPVWASLCVLFFVLVVFGYLETLVFFTVVDVLFRFGDGYLDKYYYTFIALIVYIVMTKIRPLLKLY
jgi:hypothetical protein